MAFEYNDDGYEDEEELDPIATEQEDEEDEQDEEEEQEELEEEARLQQEAEKKAIKNKLNKINRSVSTRFLPILLPSEKKTVSQGKKIDPVTVTKINATLVRKKAELAQKVISAIAPAIPYILIGLLVILVVICLAVAIDSMFGWLTGGSSTPGGTSSSEFGTSGQYVYGTRMVYEDEVLARTKLVTDYAGLVEGVVTTIENNNANFNVDITLPTEEFDYTQLITAITNSTEADTRYIPLANLVKQIADQVYMSEIGGAETDYIKILDSIPNFGVKEELKAQISSLITNGLTVTKPAEEEGQTVVVPPNEYSASVDAYLDTANLFKYQTEKLFIKDYLISVDETVKLPTDKANYKTLIYLPKQNFTFNYLSYGIGGVDTNTFGMQVSDGSHNYQFSYEELQEGSYLYETSNNVTLTATAGTFDDLSKGYSLFDIASSDSLNKDTYLIQDTETSVYGLANPTYGVYITFNFNTTESQQQNTAFNIGGFETKM